MTKDLALKIINNNIKFTNSRDVAKIIGKKHFNLLREIRRHIKYMKNLNINYKDFFIESTYKDSRNKTQPCFIVTKKGFDFICLRLKGEKGREFFNQYSNAFHEMQDAIKEIEKNLTI